MCSGSIPIWSGTRVESQSADVDRRQCELAPRADDFRAAIAFGQATSSIAHHDQNRCLCNSLQVIWWRPAFALLQDNAQPPRTSSTIIRVEDYKMLTTDQVTEENNEQDDKEKESEEDQTTTTATTTTTKKMKVIHVKRPKTKADAKPRQEFRAHASKIQVKF